MSILYVDNPPTKYSKQVKNQFKKIPAASRSYVKELFPIVEWLPKYNLIWLSSDLIAAVTIATVVVPQSLAYAKIANVPPVYGLYTSFLGVLIYPLFGTSKDVSIGTSAIISLMVGQVLGKFTASENYLSGAWTMEDASVNLALFSGLIVLLLGLFRLGFLFRYICQPAIAGFMAGSGLTIVINQFNKIFGVPHINTSEVPYLVFGKTLINLNHSTVDAAFGISALIYLYGVRYLSQHLMHRYPQYSRAIFFFNISRSIVVLVFSTLICFMVNRFGHFEKSPMSVIGIIEPGLNHIAVPTVKTDLVSFFLSDLPGIVVLMVMEHGAISTSLGRTAEYTVNMSQEMLSTGLANVFGSFFCAYPGTGAFSRSAVMSKSGARTPLTSFFVGVFVLISIYVFTPAFTYISTAALSAIIAHAVTDLISGPSAWKRYWDKDPIELLIYACAYVISLCTRIDIAVYVPVILSILVQLYRSGHPRYAVLSRLDLDQERDHPLYFRNDGQLQQYLHPVDPSIIVFRPEDNIVFENASYLFEKLTEEMKRTTRRGKAPAAKVGDRPWNNADSVGKGVEKPLLQSVILDLSGVHQMDYTGMEELIEASVSIERYSGQFVHWYIITGDSLSVRKSLLFAGFGNQRRDAKTPGRFISDLRHGINEGGHLPGIASCRAFDTEEKRLPGYEHVVTIENVTKEHKSFLDKLKKKGDEKDSIVTLEDGDSVNNNTDNNNAALKKTISDDSNRWCYCDYHENSDLPSTISAVYDRFPFFFLSVDEAVHAALLRKRFLEDQQTPDTISVISDRAGNASPADEGNSSS